MKDSFFLTKRYQGLYEPLYRFKEYGDTENYWIKLRYVCNRDDWQSIKTAKGTALDFDLKNEDGDKIFGEIPTVHFNTLLGRGYVLGGNSEPESASDDGSLVSVEETYVYAPNKIYTTYDSDIVPIWGMKDTDYATQTAIVFGTGAGNVIRNQFYRDSIIHVTDASQFKTGDYVISHLTCSFGYNNGVSVPMWYDAWVESVPQKIMIIDGNFLELSGEISWNIFDEKYADYETHYIYNYEKFFGCINGGSLPSDYDLTLKPTSGYILRAYSTRVNKKRERLTKEEVTFHSSFPNLSNCEIFIPQQQTGTEYTDISRETTMTPQAWKAKVAAGDWFIYAEPKVTYDAAANIYELHIKKTPCK